MIESRNLLTEYARHGSEAAFSELVARYVDFVFSTAVRLMRGDAQRAEDVVQIVFTNLAHQAPRLVDNGMLGGWLHRNTCFVASKMHRSERRRQNREKEAAEMHALNHPNSDLDLIAPRLDEAINELEEEDRQAVLLRFYENRKLCSVGELLGVSENAAQKRVSRALEQLRLNLSRNGIGISAASIGAALATGVITTAPAGLASGVTVFAMTAAAASATFSTSISALAVSKAKIIVGAIILGGIAAPLVIQHRTEAHLRKENVIMRQAAGRVAQLESENVRLSGVSAHNQAPMPAGPPPQELLRLRGEVGQLRLENGQLRDGATATKQVQTPAVTSNPSAALEHVIIDFRQAELPQVFALFSELSGVKLDYNERSLPHRYVRFKSNQPLTVPEAVRLLEEVLFEQTGAEITLIDSNRAVVQFHR